MSPDMNMAPVASHAGFVAKYLLSNWSIDPLITVPFIIVPTLLYIRGLGVLRRQNARTGTVALGTERKSITLFCLGMGMWIASFMSPILFWSMVYLWVHMLFHVVVMIAAPPLLASSKPFNVMAHGIPDSVKPATKRLLSSLKGNGPVGSILRFITNPWVDFIYFNFVMWFWFVPRFMTLAVDNLYVMDIMHLTFLTAGPLLFFHFVDSPPYKSRIPNPMVRMGALLLCIYSSWALAMVLGLTNSPWFSVYGNIPGKSLSLMADQQIGASILWVLCMEPLVYTGYYNIYLWLNLSDRGLFKDGATPWLKKVRRGPAYVTGELEAD